MTLETLVRVGVVVVALMAVRQLWHPSQSRLRGSRELFTQRTGAYVDPHFIASFDRESLRLQRWYLFVLLGWCVQVWIVADPGVDPWWEPLMWTGIGGLWLAALTMTRLRAAGREFAVAGWPTAVARERRVVVGDYVSAVLLVGAGVLVAAGGALGVEVFFHWRHGDVRTGDVVVGGAELALTLGMAVGTHLFARALCERPTPAVDPSHLYLQDAWRARALGWAYTLVALIAFLSALGLALASDTWAASGAFTASIYLGPAWVFFVAILQPKWFRKRLWPALAPDQILLPGQQLPARSTS